VAHLDVAGGLLILRLSLLERLAGFVRGNAEIPLSSVRGARIVESPWGELRGMRMPGTAVPRRLAVGTWRFSGGKDFVALHGGGQAVVVDLVGVEYSRLIVSTGHGIDLIVDEINEAAGGRLR
jgi:hypothetical protein